MTHKHLIFSLTLLALTACQKGTGESSSSVKKNTVGQTVFNNTCKVCHSQGINGAPIYGNAAMWSGRVEQGIPALAKHATEGYGLMPAKGGNDALTDTEILAAVTYMVDAVTQ